MDTGYDGDLSLPRELISELGLEWVRRGVTELADGSYIHADHFRAALEWDGRQREVVIEEANTTPLLGALGSYAGTNSPHRCGRTAR